jgi:hypothetical protein
MPCLNCKVAIELLVYQVGGFFKFVIRGAVEALCSKAVINAPFLLHCSLRVIRGCCVGLYLEISETALL